MHEQLVALYHRHVAAAYDKQLRLGDFLERETDGATWNYHVSTGTLSFGPTVKFQAMDLGSHSTPDNTWLWGWYSSQLSYTAMSGELAASVVKIGDRYKIDAFLATQAIDLRPILGEDLSRIAANVFGIIVSGELGYHAYYTMPYRRGRSTVLLRDERLRINEPNPLGRVALIFPQVLTGFPILDQRAALIGYLNWYAYVPKTEGQVVRVVEEGVELMRAEFDEDNRMTSLTGTFQACE